MTTQTTSFPARLHVFLARDNPHQGLVLRRGPANQVATIGWNRSNDTFMLGQWCKGRIYEYECDLSPDGKYFLYAATDKRNEQRWTALSEVPYLTALDLSFNPMAVLGGGFFISKDTYWVNYPNYTFLNNRFKRSPLIPVVQHPAAPKLKVWNGLYLHKLQYDGWFSIHSIDGNEYCFSKPINSRWQLIKTVHLKCIKRALGQAYIHETHQLVDVHNKRNIDFPDWEWADIDSERIVFAQKGKLCSLPFTKNELDIGKTNILYDFTPMVFEEIKAPYDRRHFD